MKSFFCRSKICKVKKYKIRQNIYIFVTTIEYKTRRLLEKLKQLRRFSIAAPSLSSRGQCSGWRLKRSVKVELM